MVAGVQRRLRLYRRVVEGEYQSLVKYGEVEAKGAWQMVARDVRDLIASSDTRLVSDLVRCVYVGGGCVWVCGCE